MPLLPPGRYGSTVHCRLQCGCIRLQSTVTGETEFGADGQHLSIQLKVGSLTSPFSDEAPMMGPTPPGGSHDVPAT